MNRKKRLEVEILLILANASRWNGPLTKAADMRIRAAGFRFQAVSIKAGMSMTLVPAQGGLAGVLSLLEGDEFVRGILEPAGLTMEDLARPSIDAYRRPSVPPPPTDGPIPSKRSPRYVTIATDMLRRTDILPGR